MSNFYQQDPQDTAQDSLLLRALWGISENNQSICSIVSKDEVQRIFPELPKTHG